MTLGSIAQRLEVHGYDRVGLPIPWILHHVHGVERGFRRWEAPSPSDGSTPEWGQADPITTDAALSILAEEPSDGSRPFFLFVHYRCGHDPYVVHPEHDFGAATDMDRYDSAIAFCDGEFGRLLRGLDERPDRERTVVVVYSDHGELFGEHGVTSHGNSLYEPDVRVLLLVRIPGATPATVHDVVSLTDVGTTLLDLAGHPERRLDGWSLLPYVYPGPPLPPRTVPLYADSWRSFVRDEQFGVVDGTYKYMRHASGAEALFDLEHDPGETVNVASTLPGIHERMVEALDARR
jgi:arylsulfatase A-like enzyme